MPPKSRRVERCSYTEKGRRCRRNGSGNPPLCAPCRISLEETIRRATPSQNPHPRAAAGASIIDDLMTGKIGLGDAFSRVVDEIANNVAAQPQASRASPFPFPFPFPGQHWRPLGQQPPPPRPRVDTAAAEKARARTVLGFAPSEPVTIEQIKARHRELARKHHPDRGGSLQKMQAINAAVDTLTS